MKQRIEQILAEINELKCKTQKEVEEARVRLLGKKGEVTRLFEEFRTMDKELKKEFGRSLNELKQAAQNKIEEYKNSIGEEANAAGPKEDLTMPGDAFELGSRHPVSIVRQEIVDIFRADLFGAAHGVIGDLPDGVAGRAERVYFGWDHMVFPRFTRYSTALR